MFRREIVKGQESLTIFRQAIDCLFIFDAIGFDKSVKRFESILLGCRHPDLLQGSLGLWLLALRQLVQHISGFVHPTALATRFWPNFLERLPEPERAVGNGKLGPDREPTPPQVEQELFPRLRALPHPIGEADKFLFAFGCCSDNDEKALGLVLEPGLDMDAVDPEVNIAFGGQIPP